MDGPALTEAELIDRAPDAMVLVDRSGIIRLWNRRAEALFGYPAIEALGTSLDLIIPEPSRIAHWAAFRRAVERGRFANDAMLQASEASTKDGRRILVELSATLIADGQGRITGVLAIGRDLADRPAHERA